MSVYSGNPITEDSSVLESSHILDIMLENSYNDQKMFDSVITLDFLEAYEDAGYQVISEADTKEVNKNATKGIFAKILDRINDVIKKIGAFVDKWLTRFINVIANDDKLYTTNLENFNKNAVGYVCKYRPTKDLDEAFKTYESRCEEVLDISQKFADKIKDASSSEEYADIVDDARAEFGKYDPEQDADDAVYSGDEDALYKITKNDARTINEIMGSADLVKNHIKTLKNNLKTIGKAMMRNTSELKSRKSGETDTTEIARLNAAFSITNLYLVYLNQYTGNLLNRMSKALAQARKIFIQAAKVKTNTAQECAMFGYASDLYMEAVLLDID